MWRDGVLTRQKAVLSLLTQAGRPLSPTVIVKLIFLLREETDLGRNPSFYDFVPYKYGPFSFTLYWEMGYLRQNGYVTPDEERIALCGRALDLAEKQADELPASIQAAVADVLSRYGRMNQSALVRNVYTRYPWFALNSELPERHLASIQRPKKAPPAVYTAGYEGRSVDAFFNDLLKQGIEVVVDVRANPVSRKYGFSRPRFAEISRKLGFEYHHFPALGIPSDARADLGSFASYQRLLDRYSRVMLPERASDVGAVGRLICRQPSVLVCVEKDVRCCHRSRLADAVALATGLEVVHL